MRISDDNTSIYPSVSISGAQVESKFSLVVEANVIRFYITNIEGSVYVNGCTVTVHGGAKFAGYITCKPQGTMYKASFVGDDAVFTIPAAVIQSDTLIVGEII